MTRSRVSYGQQSDPIHELSVLKLHSAPFNTPRLVALCTPRVRSVINTYTANLYVTHSHACSIYVAIALEIETMPFLNTVFGQRRRLDDLQ